MLWRVGDSWQSNSFSVSFLPLLAVAGLTLLVSCAPAEQASASKRDASPVSNRTPGSRDFPQIYRDMGPLYVKEGSYSNESPIKPWSSWWYPTRDPRKLETLRKYDEINRIAYGDVTSAEAFEKEMLLNPQAEGWEGLCHAWALVSLMYPEPSAPVQISGIPLSVSDQKYLLIKTYEQYMGQYYGQNPVRRAHPGRSGLPPHHFHRFVMAQMIEQGRPFVMNKVSGGEIWNVPIWKAQMTVTRDTEKPDVFHVQAWLVAAGLHFAPSDQLGSVHEVIYYTYDLYTEPDETGQELAVFGSWTGSSKDVQPSIVMKLPEREIPHRSLNEHISEERVHSMIYR